MKLRIAAAAATVIVGLSAIGPVAAQPVPSQASPVVSEHAVCGPPGAGNARCHVHVVDNGSPARPRVSGSPSGLDPATVKTAYNFPTSATAGTGKTIAIVDAYDNPTIESDLATFSTQFGLPQCTTANGCFRKVNQTGGTNYPRTDSGWALEIALDVEWAHAIAPGAKILLVEASSNSFTNLLTAEDYAKTHAQYVSNSWGGNEFSSESSYDSHFVQSGVAFFVSAGDAGLPAEYPSSSPKVVSVGGTNLVLNHDGTVTETAWTDGGGGCSVYETAASAQSGFAGYSQANCGGKRATPDVSLVADPATGVSVYDTTTYSGQSGWFTVGGTSASAPMTAGHAAAVGVAGDAAYLYGNSPVIRDITYGNNGASCLVGFDLCSGRGSWTESGAPQNVSPSNPPPSSNVLMKVADIAWSTTGRGGKDLHIDVSITTNQSPAVAVSGATVSLSLAFPGGSVGTASGTTNSSGVASFVVRNASSGTYTATVTNVTSTTYNWDGNQYTESYTK